MAAITGLLLLQLGDESGGLLPCLGAPVVQQVECLGQGRALSPPHGGGEFCRVTGEFCLAHGLELRQLCQPVVAADDVNHIGHDHIHVHISGHVELVIKIQFDLAVDQSGADSGDGVSEWTVTNL